MTRPQHLAAFALVLASGCASSTVLERHWYTLTVDGERVGYAYQEREASAGGDVLRIAR